MEAEDAAVFLRIMMKIIKTRVMMTFTIIRIRIETRKRSVIKAKGQGSQITPSR